MVTKKSGAVTVVMIEQKFDAHTAERIEEELLALVESGGVKIVCNLSQTDFLSSAGLRVILAVGKAAKRHGGALALASPQPYVRNVLETVGLAQVFTIAHSEEEAIGAVA